MGESFRHPGGSTSDGCVERGSLTGDGAVEQPSTSYCPPGECSYVTERYTVGEALVCHRCKRMARFTATFESKPVEIQDGHFQGGLGISFGLEPPTED